MAADNKSIPLVSIIIPLYNAEKYIAGTIQSALDQTWPNTEIIIIDDGSEDQSLSVAQKFRSDKIFILKQYNKGASAARNHGLKKSKGEYIQFLDADDLLSAYKIEEQVKLLTNQPGYISVCGTVHFQDGQDPYKIPVNHEWFSAGSDDPTDFLIKLYGGGLIGPEYGGMIQPNAWLCPKGILDKAGEWNEELTVDDDGEYFCRVVLAARGIKYAEGAANYYRKFNTNANLSAKKSFASCRSNLTSTQLKAKYLLTKTDNEKARIAVSRVLWENAVNFYPDHKSLATEAEKQAIALNPGFKFKVYNSGVKNQLERMFGWKMIKQIQSLRNK